MDGAASFFTNGDRLDQRVQLHHVRDQPPAAQGPGVRRWGSASVRGVSASLREGDRAEGGCAHEPAAANGQPDEQIGQPAHTIAGRRGRSSSALCPLYRAPSSRKHALALKPRKGGMCMPRADRAGSKCDYGIVPGRCAAARGAFFRARLTLGRISAPAQRSSRRWPAPPKRRTPSSR